MEVRVRERLIGALVLVAIVVLVVPAVLTGRGKPEAPPAAEGEVVINLAGDAPEGPTEEAPVPEEALEGLADPDPEPSSVDAARAEPLRPPSEPTPREASPAASRPAVPPRPSPPPEPAPATTATTPAWAVQLGAFSHRDKADELIRRLRARGYSAFVLEYRAGGQVLYRVRVGPEQDRERAASIAERLKKDGFQAVVARHP